MKARLLPVMSIALSLTLFVGCNNMNKQDVGAVSGGVLGGLIGSQFGQGQGAVAAAVGGTLIGALIGGSIGKNMDDQDRANMQAALERNRSNQSSEWRNPDSGTSYQVTPQTAYRGSGGQPCREYTTTASIGGKRQQVYGTACRQADGSWQTVAR
jgi:surface antigen